ncbi:hypothetical protein Pmani_030074 [Petrolisthes manimaculis]|uniref:Uncharacterized protein n=1 Tax=Petrolisthes manimaculis TaxID=1843537 RepID=A0AAE1TWA9_9EUCA|nr:hypothetical protein Pmani_030074 [Petrolisthes manimaculis]
MEVPFEMKPLLEQHFTTVSSSLGLVKMCTMADDVESVMLKWTDHKQVFARVLSTLREKEVFADVLLYCGRKRYAAHKFILSTCSSYLEGVLAGVGSEAEPVSLVLADTRPAALEALLDFMYLGKADLEPSLLDPLLDLAHDLRVRGLITPSLDPEAQKMRELMRSQKVTKPPKIVQWEETKVSEGENEETESPELKQEEETKPLEVPVPVKRIEYPTPPEKPKYPEIRRRKVKPSTLQVQLLEEERKIRKERDKRREELLKQDMDMAAAMKRYNVLKTMELGRKKQEKKKRQIEQSKSKERCSAGYREEKLRKRHTMTPEESRKKEKKTMKSIEEKERKNEKKKTSKINERENSKVMEMMKSPEVDKEREPSSQVGEMEQHMMSFIPKNFLCKFCQDSFCSFQDLDLHHRSTHEKKMLTCSECSFRTPFKDNMSKHIATHISSVPYVCLYCLASDPLEELHINHQRKFHPGRPVRINKPSNLTMPAIKRKMYQDVVRPSKVIVKDIMLEKKLTFSPSPSPTNMVLNSPGSNTPPSPTSSGVYQFTMASPSSSPVPPKPPNPIHTSSSPPPPSSLPVASPVPPLPSSSSSSQLSPPVEAPPTSSCLSSSPSSPSSPILIPQTTSCFVQLFRGLSRSPSPDPLAGSESDTGNKYLSESSSSASSSTRKRGRPLGSDKKNKVVTKRHKHSSSSAIPKRSQNLNSNPLSPSITSQSPTHSLASTSSEDSNPPSPQSCPRKMSSRGRGSALRIETLKRHSREK